jgi:lipoic acid synthetase
LTAKVRHKATYRRSLMILKHAKQSGKVRFVKSGLMVGLGETKEQVGQTLVDLRDTGCDIVTIGHYLQPSQRKMSVKAFIDLETFEEYRRYGESIGIRHVYAGPFVRSSYNADLLTTLAIKG